MTASIDRRASGPAPRSRAARQHDLLQGMAAGGRAAHADEQPRSRGRRASGRSRRLRRHREGGAQLGVLRRDRRARCARSRTTRRCSCRAASRSACSARTPARRACSSRTATSWGAGRRGTCSASSSGRAHHVRPDDGRLVDLHRLAGDPAGHLRDVRRRRAAALRRHARAAASCSPPDSAAWAARSRSPPRCRAPRFLGVEVDEARIDEARRDAATAIASTRASTRRSRGSRTRSARGEAAVGRPGRQRGGRAARARAARRHARRAHRPDERARHAERLRARRACRSRTRPRCGATRSRRSTSRARRRRRSRTCRRCSSMQRARRGHLRLRQQHSHGRARRRRRATRSTFPASFRSTCARSSARGRVRSAGSRSPAIRRTSIAPTSWCSSSFRTTTHLARWITLAREKVHFQGLPARICWLGQGERAKFGVALNDLVASGELSAPIVIGRDHLDTGQRGVAVPRDGGDEDGSDADRRLGRSSTRCSTSRAARRWVSFHHGGGVGHRQLAARGPGDRRRRHAGDARATASACSRTIPGIGVARHADAGYEIAVRHGARSRAFTLPMQSVDRASERADMLMRAVQAVARPALRRRSTRGCTCERLPGARALRGHACAATRAAASATTGRPTRTATRERARELRRRGAVLQSDDDHLHRRRADAAARSRGARRGGRRARSALKYITLITHGAMLTPERARSLWEAGHQPVQHLARLSRRAARHARAASPDSRRRSSTPCPRMRARGIDSIRFNTVIKNDNLDQLLPIVRRAAGAGGRRIFSAYTDAKNGNRAHLVARDELAASRRGRSASCWRSSAASAA